MLVLTACAAPASESDSAIVRGVRHRMTGLPLLPPSRRAWRAPRCHSRIARGGSRMAAGRRIARGARPSRRARTAPWPGGRATRMEDRTSGFDPGSATARLEPSELAHERARLALGERRQQIAVVDLDPVEHA